jgi:multiple sugar transport system substrate-binding protein
MLRKSPRLLNRRKFLQHTLAATMALGWTPALKALAAEQKTRNAEKLARQGDNILNIIAIGWPQAPVEQKLADEVFTPETGIEVALQISDYAATEQRVLQLVAGQSAEFDIYHYDSQWIGGFIAAGGMEPLDELLAASSAMKFEDFHPTIAERLGRYNGKIYGLPWSLNCQVLNYRKDLIETPPDTWEEVRAMAKELTTADMYGWVWEGSRTSDWIMVDYCPLFWSNGGELWDEENWIADGFVNSDAGVQSLEMMRAMVDPDQDGSVDPASGNWTIGERIGAYGQGRAAMGLSWVPLIPAESMNENMGVALSPAGPGGRFHMMGSQGTGINALGSKKDKAFQYLEWLLSKETQEALTTTPEAAFFSARVDLQEVSAAQSQNHAIFAQAISSIKDFWNNASYQELMLSLGGELNLAYIGRKSAQDALDDAALRHQVIYDFSPENPKNQG